MVRTIQNKLFYKGIFRRDSPDEDLIKTNLATFKRAENYFSTYFLGNKDFLGDKSVNLADIVACCTFEQVTHFFTRERSSKGLLFTLLFFLLLFLLLLG
jgi:hypothetical protein